MKLGKLLTIITSVLLLFSACDRLDKVREIPVNDFFKTQEKTAYRISPDGAFISYLQQKDGESVLMVESVMDGNPKEIIRSTGKNISFYAWVSDDELIYYKEVNSGVRKSDLYIISKDGKNERQLTYNEERRMQVLDEQLIDGKFLLIASNKRDSAVIDVYRLNVRDGKFEMAAKNPGNITRWITDRAGKLRLAISSDGVNETFLYRLNEQEAFRPVLSNSNATYVRPVAFSENYPNIIYAISNSGRDKNALVEIDCNTGKETKVLFENDSLNVVDAQYSRSRKKMVFVVYETWKKQKHYLDAGVKALYDKLDELLPNTETRISDRDKNDNVLIVRTFTDRNPGSYYLFFVNEGKIRKLGDFNPSINEQEMSKMEPIKFKSRDGLDIEGYLTLPLYKSPTNLPLVVIPNSGPGVRNSWGYNAEVQFLANRGFAVLQINARGSAGYGKNFYVAGFKQLGLKINDDYEDGVKWLVKKNIIDQKKVAIYGSGFGGFIALSSVYRNPGTYTVAASNAGILNMFGYLKSFPAYYNANLHARYEIYGDPRLDNEYLNKVSPIFNVDKIKTPIFINVNVKDTRLSPAEGIQFIKQLQKQNTKVTYIENQDQPFSPRRDENRQKLYTQLEEFLSANLK